MNTAIISRNDSRMSAAKNVRRRGRPSREEAERIDRDLLEHALNCFIEKGFDRTTIDEITGSLGMSKRTVYLRYNDKLELFKAALNGGIEVWLAPLKKLRKFETDNLEESLTNVAYEIVRTLNSPEGIKFIRITNAESHRMPEIGKLLYFRGYQVISNYIVDLLERRIFFDVPHKPDLEDLSGAFQNLISSPARLTAWGLQSTQSDMKEFARSRVKLFLHGILPAGTSNS